MTSEIKFTELLADVSYQINEKDVNAAYIEAGDGLGTFLECCCRYAHDEDGYWDITLGELKDYVIDALVKYWYVRKNVDQLMAEATGVKLVDDGYFGDRYYLIRKHQLAGDEDQHPLCWMTGYVSVGKGEEGYGNTSTASFDDLDVYGGITYAGWLKDVAPEMVGFAGNEYVIGFDTAHFLTGDPVLNSLEFIRTELEDLAKQLDKRQKANEMRRQNDKEDN